MSTTPDPQNPSSDTPSSATPSSATPSSATPSSTRPQIVRLIGVYDADSTIRGELAYFIGARLGQRHCSLCDITHGLVRQRPEWRACRAGLPVPFDTFHRNDQPAAVAALLNGTAPAVVAESTEGLTVLLGPDGLDQCRGSIEALVAAIDSAVEQAGLGWAVQDPD